MRKYLAGIVALIMLCLSGCGLLPASGGNAASDDIKSSLNDKIAEAIAQSLSPSPGIGPSASQGPIPSQTPKEAESLHDEDDWEHWAQMLEGWWVDMSSYGDGDYVQVNYFTSDGTVYLSPEDYWQSLENAAEFDIRQWTLVDGQPYLIKTEGNTPIYGTIEIDELGGMFVEWQGDDFRYYERNTSFWATNFLLDGPYYYLAENARLAWVRFGEDLSTEEGYVTIWVNDVIWVGSYQEDLIKEYGLEDADFNNDYEIYDTDPNYYPMEIMNDDLTTFRVCGYDGEGFLVSGIRADFIEFKRLVDDQGERGMLVYYGGEEGTEYIFSMTEIYVP
ncbi:MAG: hypothetical protein ACOX8S_08965 [Christensenellales bacterium]|jgi:hypothetical protein